MSHQRVPFGWNDGDVMASAGPRVGERFSVNVDVDEGRWRDQGFAAEVVKEAIRVAVDHLLRQDGFILQERVRELLHSREFIQPILEDEIRRTAREFVFGILTDEGSR